MQYVKQQAYTKATQFSLARAGKSNMHLYLMLSTMDVAQELKRGRPVLYSVIEERPACPWRITILVDLVQKTADNIFARRFLACWVSVVNDEAQECV